MTACIHIEKTNNKHIKNYQEINSKRGLRYFGPSKMSLFKLGIHSFAIIAVFKYSVYLRSLLLIACLFFSKNILGVYWVVMSLILITFNICIFLVSLREDQKALENSENSYIKDTFKKVHHPLIYSKECLRLPRRTFEVVINGN